MGHNTMILFAGWVSGVQATGTAHIATSIARVARERETQQTECRTCSAAANKKPDIRPAF